MRLKSGVRLSKGDVPGPGVITAPLVVAMMIVDGVYRAHDVELVITAVFNGEHMGGSKHYSGEGFDARTHNVPPAELPIMVAEIKGALGDEFDVVFEGAGTPNAHLHVEYDPEGE